MIISWDFFLLLQKYRIDELRSNGFEAFAVQDEKGIIY